MFSASNLIELVISLVFYFIHPIKLLLLCFDLISKCLHLLRVLLQLLSPSDSDRVRLSHVDPLSLGLRVGVNPRLRHNHRVRLALHCLRIVRPLIGSLLLRVIVMVILLWLHNTGWAWLSHAVGWRLRLNTVLSERGGHAGRNAVGLDVVDVPLRVGDPWVVLMQILGLLLHRCCLRLRHVRDRLLLLRLWLGRFGGFGLIENILLVQNCVTEFILYGTSRQVSLDPISDQRHLQHLVHSRPSGRCDRQTPGDQGSQLLTVYRAQGGVRTTHDFH